MDAITIIKNSLTKEKIMQIMIAQGANHIVDTGETFRSTCPLHGGDNPTSFVWNYTNGLWYCFTECARGGDIFDFVSILLDLPIEHEFKTVVKKAAEMLGVDITNLDFNQNLCQRREMWFNDQRQWLDYMQKKMNKNTNQGYDLHKLGENYVVNSYRNFTDETLKNFDVLYNKQYNRLVIPIHTNDGILVGAILRRVNESEQAKWLNRPKAIDTGKVLYNLNNITDKVELFIVEGAFDVFNMYQLDVKNVVASFGAHLTEYQRIILLETGVLKLILAYDTDAAGREATHKAIDKLKHSFDLYVYDFAEHDPGEIQEHKSELIIPWYKWMQKYYPEPEV